MFEKLDRRTAQFAASVQDRVSNLIDEHHKLLEKNRQLKGSVKFLLRTVDGLMSTPDIAKIIAEQKAEELRFIEEFRKGNYEP